MPAAQIVPETRVRSWHVWLLVWRVHRWIAFGFGALLVLLSATGSLLVLHHELEHVIEPERHLVRDVAADTSMRPLGELTAMISDYAPSDFRLFRILPADDARTTHKFLFLGPDHATRWAAFVEPASGKIRWTGPDQRLFTPWLLHLHMQLHLGRAGFWITGAAGIALTLLALTGLYLHRERLAALWRHPFRLRFGWRVALADLHKWIGIGTLYFPLVLGITGTLYVWSILGAKPAVSAVANLRPADLPALEPLRADALRHFPGAEVLRFQFPADAKGAITVLLLHRTNPPWQKFSRVDFDAQTGALRKVRDAKAATAGEQFRSMLAPLHFGFYGASWVKWAYFVGGFTPAMLAFTGAALWVVRQRSKRRN